ncbi:MAG: hypothetical protein ACI3VA_03455 [Candidatus Limivicinus sp.]
MRNILWRRKQRHIEQQKKNDLKGIAPSRSLEKIKILQWLKTGVANTKSHSNSPNETAF